MKFQSYTSNEVALEFNVWMPNFNRITHRLYLLGSPKCLGSWSIENALLAYPTIDLHVWRVQSALPPNTRFEWVWLKKNVKTKKVEWERPIKRNRAVGCYSGVIHSLWGQHEEVFLQRAANIEVTTYKKVDDGFVMVITGASITLGVWDLRKAVIAREFPKKSGYWKAQFGFDASTNVDFKWAIVKHKDHTNVQEIEKMPHHLYGRQTWMRVAAPWMTTSTVVVDVSPLNDLCEMRRGRTDLIVQERKKRLEEIREWVVKSRGSITSQPQSILDISRVPQPKATRSRATSSTSVGISPSPSTRALREAAIEEGILQRTESLQKAERLTKQLSRDFRTVTKVFAIKGAGQTVMPTDSTNAGWLWRSGLIPEGEGRLLRQPAPRRPVSLWSLSMGLVRICRLRHAQQDRGSTTHKNKPGIKRPQHGSPLPGANVGHVENNGSSRGAAVEKAENCGLLNSAKVEPAENGGFVNGAKVEPVENSGGSSLCAKKQDKLLEKESSLPDSEVDLVSDGDSFPSAEVERVEDGVSSRGTKVEQVAHGGFLNGVGVEQADVLSRTYERGHHMELKPPSVGYATVRVTGCSRPAPDRSTREAPAESSVEGNKEAGGGLDLPLAPFHQTKPYEAASGSCLCVVSSDEHVSDDYGASHELVKQELEDDETIVDDSEFFRYLELSHSVTTLKLVADNGEASSRGQKSCCASDTQVGGDSGLYSYGGADADISRSVNDGITWTEHEVEDHVSDACLAGRELGSCSECGEAAMTQSNGATAGAGWSPSCIATTRAAEDGAGSRWEDGSTRDRDVVGLSSDTDLGLAQRDEDEGFSESESLALSEAPRNVGPSPLFIWSQDLEEQDWGDGWVDSRQARYWEVLHHRAQVSVPLLALSRRHVGRSMASTSVSREASLDRSLTSPPPLLQGYPYSRRGGGERMVGNSEGQGHPRPAFRQEVTPRILSGRGGETLGDMYSRHSERQGWRCWTMADTEDLEGSWHHQEEERGGREELDVEEGKHEEVQNEKETEAEDDLEQLDDHATCECIDREMFARHLSENLMECGSRISERSTSQLSLRLVRDPGAAAATSLTSHAADKLVGVDPVSVTSESNTNLDTGSEEAEIMTSSEEDSGDESGEAIWDDEEMAEEAGTACWPQGSGGSYFTRYVTTSQQDVPCESLSLAERREVARELEMQWGLQSEHARCGTNLQHDASSPHQHESCSSPPGVESRDTSTTARYVCGDSLSCFDMKRVLQEPSAPLSSSRPRAPAFKDREACGDCSAKQLPTSGSSAMTGGTFQTDQDCDDTPEVAGAEVAPSSSSPIRCRGSCRLPRFSFLRRRYRADTFSPVEFQALQRRETQVDHRARARQAELDWGRAASSRCHTATKP